METTTHPYWPRNLSLPGYVSNVRPGWQCAGAVAAAGAGLLALGWALNRNERSPVRRVAAGWFLVCAGIHGVLEGYFSVRHRELPADTGLLGEVWKEYAKADSRYVTSDDFTVAMETVTAWAWGPLSFLTFVSFLSRHRSRFVLQLIVSLGQLYGDVLYFATEARAGWTHSDPHPLYFWVYFVVLNGVWLVVPSALIIDAWNHLCAAQRDHDRPHKKGH